MSKWAIALFLAVAAILPVTARSQDVCAILDGAVIIAQDDANTYLGKVSSPYDSDSIFNQYGTYGNEYSSSSIWNEYSKFGNQYNTYSPFNEYSSKPPMLIKFRSLIGYLTANKSIQGGISPNLLKALCGS